MGFVVEEAQKNSSMRKIINTNKTLATYFTVFKNRFISGTRGIVRNNEQLNTSKNLMHAIQQLNDHSGSAILFQGFIIKYFRAPSLYTKRDFCSILHLSGTHWVTPFRNTREQLALDVSASQPFADNIDWLTETRRSGEEWRWNLLQIWHPDYCRKHKPIMNEKEL